MTENTQKIKLAGVVPESVVDGKGIRFTIFTQGCPHRCEGCHNPQTHDYEGGKEYDIDDIKNAIAKNPILDGVTFSGGEPFVFAKQLAELADFVHAKNMNIWCYTGYTYEELKANNDESTKNLLDKIDILIDGKFDKGKKDLTLNFRGSKNQRIIDLRKMRENRSKEIIELEV